MHSNRGETPSRGETDGRPTAPKAPPPNPREHHRTTTVDPKSAAPPQKGRRAAALPTARRKPPLTRHARRLQSDAFKKELMQSTVIARSKGARVSPGAEGRGGRAHGDAPSGEAAPADVTVTGSGHKPKQGICPEQKQPPFPSKGRRHPQPATSLHPPRQA